MSTKPGQLQAAKKAGGDGAASAAGKAAKAVGGSPGGKAAVRKIVRAAASTAKKTAAAVAKATKGAGKGAKAAKGAAAEATESAVQSAVESGSEVSAATPGDVDPDAKGSTGLEYWQWVGELALQVATGIPDSLDWAPGANKLNQIGHGWVLMNCEVSGPHITELADPTVELLGLVNCSHPTSGAGDRDMGSDADCAALAAGKVPPRLVPKNGGSTSFPCGGVHGNRELPWGEVWPAEIALR